MTIVTENKATDPFFDLKDPVAEKNPNGFHTLGGTYFRLTDKGVSVTPFDKNGQKNEFILCGQLVVKAEFISESGDQFSRLVEFSDDYGRLHQVLIPKGDISLGKLFKNPCCQAEWNKNVPFGFS